MDIDSSVQQTAQLIPPTWNVAVAEPPPPPPPTPMPPMPPPTSRGDVEDIRDRCCRGESGDGQTQFTKESVGCDDEQGSDGWRGFISVKGQSVTLQQGIECVITEEDDVWNLTR